MEVTPFLLLQEVYDMTQVEGEDSLQGFEVREYQVVMRGRKKKG